MSFDSCYLDNESKDQYKNQHVQYDFKDMLMMLQPAESEVNMVATSPLGGFQPQRCSTCSLGCLQVSSARSVALLVGHLHDKGGRQLLALGVYATRVRAKQRYRTVAAA